MRVNLTIILLACIASLSGQNVKVTKHYEITPSVGQSAFYPILSPDGNRIVYTSENFSGLKSYDFASGKPRLSLLPREPGSTRFSAPTVQRCIIGRKAS